MAIISEKKFDRTDRNAGLISSENRSLSDSHSIIGKNLKINGDVRGNEELTVEGSIKGTISVNNTLIIGREGVVSAEIEAKAVVIMGKAEGKIVATDRVEIATNGEFLGDVHSKKLIIKEGAVFKGNVNMEDVPDISGSQGKAESSKSMVSSQQESKK